MNKDGAATGLILPKEKVEHILSRLGIKKLKSEAICTHGFANGVMYKLLLLLWEEGRS